MICPKCETENPDGSAFCHGCGEPLFDSVLPEIEPKKKSRKPLIIGLVTMVLVVALVLAFILSPSTPERMVKDYIEAMCAGDADAMWDASNLQSMGDDILIGNEDWDEDTFDDFKDYVLGLYEDIGDDFVSNADDYFDGDWSVDVYITDSEQVDEDALEEYAEFFVDTYGVEVTADDGYEVSYKFVVGNDDDSETYRGSFYVLKMDGHWLLW